MTRLTVEELQQLTYLLKKFIQELSETVEESGSPEVAEGLRAVHFVRNLSSSTLWVRSGYGLTKQKNRD